MKCLNCQTTGIPLTTQICPKCGNHIPSSMIQMLPIGSYLNSNKYYIEYPLGQGGFGITYRAHHTQLEKIVAIKEFFPQNHVIRETTTSQIKISQKNNQELFNKGLQRFLREGKILAIIEHPNIVKVTDLFEEKGTAYLVMEFLQGHSLREELNQAPNKKLSKDRIKTIMKSLVSALDTIHKQKIYHLDIKPDNVMITPEGKIVLIDFGAAKQKLGNHSTYSYTLEYAAPEIIAEGDVGPFSDLFELGMMLYEMLSGEKAPNGLSRLIKDTWKPKDLESPWLNLITSALQIKSEDRLSSLGITTKNLDQTVYIWWNKIETSHITVSQTGHGDYKTINEALQAAPIDGIIKVLPGLYQEGLVLNKPVTIYGEGNRDEIVIANKHGSCVLMKCDRATVKGFTLRGRSAKVGKEHNTVDIPQGELILENCDITSDSLANIAIYGSKSNPTIRSCQIHDGNSCGIWVYDQGTPTIEHCDIFANASSGIVIGTEANPTIRSCQIHDGNSCGIWVFEQGTGTIEHCDIFANAYSGIEIETKANPTIRSCQIHDGKFWGIWVHDQGTGTIEHCDIFANASSGISITTKANPIIRSCQIHDGKFCGIRVHDQGTGTIENCIIKRNSYENLSIDANCNVKTVNNQITRGFLDFLGF